jgi:thiol-disulfide isomerase/thioredoxin
MMKLFLSFILLLTFGFIIASAQNSSATFEGQVVCCADCWVKADRTKVEYGTAEDLLSARSCVEGGDPTLLAVRQGEKFTLYQLEQGRFRLPGKNWLEFVGKKIVVTGAVRQSKKANVIRVDALEVIAPSLAEREAANILGREVELTLKDLFGATASLTQYRGRIIILNFWATYCAPCRQEMPDLAAIQNEYAALGVQVIGASADEAGDRAKVLQFIRETKINFPIWLGAGASDMVRFGLGTALPGTVIIGRDGHVVKIISGIVNQADLKKQLDQMLASAEATAKREQIAQAEKERPAKASAVPS